MFLDSLVNQMTESCHPQNAAFTEKQGQYLTFIHTYTKINGRPPAEADMQRYFQVTPSTVHQMILGLDRIGLIERIPGKSRSIRVLDPHSLPALK